MDTSRNVTQTSLGSSIGPQMPGAFVPSPASSERMEREGVFPKAPSVPVPASTAEPEPEPLRKAAPEPSRPVEASEPIVSPPVQAPATSEELDEDISRPGLGRMFKSKPSKPELASQFRKAATTYGAFKPRAGGAADRLRAAKEARSPTEPDGITGVIPAPSLSRGLSDNSAPISPLVSPAQEPEKRAMREAGPMPVQPPQDEEVPELKVTSPISPTVDMELEPMEEDDVVAPLSPNKPVATEQPKVVDPKEEEARKKERRRSRQQAKYLSNLGVDVSLLDGRGLEFETILSDFGWGAMVLHPKKIEVMEADIRREIGRVEAGSWLGHLEQKDDRVEAVEKMLDRAIAECDELEGLLTLYSVELSSLNDDIAYIEAQSQGLQVQTANQKLLQTELSNLVQTVSVSSRELEPLRQASVGTGQGLVDIENALLLLYKAMITIDPAIRQGSDVHRRPGSSSMFHNSELSSMRALQEKKDRYFSEARMFLDRLKQFLDMHFGACFMDAKDALDRQRGTRLDSGPHDVARQGLWQYSPLLLFAKEIDIVSWEALMKLYQARARAIYQDELRDNANGWKAMARKPTGEDADLLFSTAEKETGGDALSSTARRLTVKRTGTLAKSFRTASGEKASRADRSQSGRLYPYEAFASALDEVTPLIFAEQNFIVDFFHATSTTSIDFTDAVTVAAPEQRRGTNLDSRRMYEPDRTMARRVAELMDDLYSFWPGDLQKLIDWAIASDPLQAIGILCALERKLLALEETNQDFLNQTLQKLHERLVSKLQRFVDEQIRAIEDTKVKIKKRKGIIAFMRVFPNFSDSIENMLTANSGPEAPMERLDIRGIVDDAYQKINKAMFESLRVIAKESPAVMVSAAAGQPGADPEDKEALNYHILLIENMNHFLEEVDSSNVAVLAQWKIKAGEEMAEHLSLYVDAVIRRPLGRVLDFLDTAATHLSNLPPNAPATSLAQRASHKPSVCRKLLASYDSRELRKGVEALKRRVEKHFGDADEPTLSRNLVAKVLKACEDEYKRTVERAEDLRRDAYASEEGLQEGWWKASEVEGAFRKGY
ncbi:hypothetical protein LTS18_007353 [Coniosporium uncinatum]|uniref:Uncharacterized protein n=1 Tax=Coniosporium uncinatum TaxID=93489 RepID=A0ACC3DAN8_9PEZI|nr:hypothetical protein LTS18_007353 [Coniosporium uncinatum]